MAGCLGHQTITEPMLSLNVFFDIHGIRLRVISQGVLMNLIQNMRSGIVTITFSRIQWLNISQRVCVMYLPMRARIALLELGNCMIPGHPFTYMT